MPENLMCRYDADLAKIASYLTFDGHLSQDLKCFYLSSKNRETSLDFQNIVYKKFGLNGKFEDGSGYGQSFKYRVFSANISRFLENAQIPKGSKVTKEFLVPGWIKNNREFSREYLRTAFDCEGSIWREKQIKIRFEIFKVEEFLSNGIEFINDIISMLKTFNVEATKPWLMKGNLRKDNKTTLGIYFKIKQSSTLKFASKL